MIKTILCVAMAVSASAISAFAIPTSLGVDFRSVAWKSANGAPSGSVNNVIASATFPPGSTLGWTSTEGIGVNGYGGATTIGLLEIMDVKFTLGSGSGLTGAWVTNLFYQPFLGETGLLALTTTSGATKTILFSGLNTAAQNPLGDVFVGFGGSYNVVDAKFFGITGNYSVAGFSKVPEGGTTLALLGMGLLGLSALRRRRSSKAARITLG
jgi:hypothetical protein